VQAARALVDVLADLFDVFVRELPVQVGVERACAVSTGDHRALSDVLASTPSPDAEPSPFAWTLLPDVNPAAFACSHKARCRRRRPRNKRLMTVPLATPVASAISA
jgi:hypothetical protein